MKIFYSSFFTAVIAIFSYNASAQVQPLTFTAVMDMSTPAGGSSGKAVMLTANQSIADPEFLHSKLLQWKFNTRIKF